MSSFKIGVHPSKLDIQRYKQVTHFFIQDTKDKLLLMLYSHLPTSLPQPHDNCNCHIKSDIDNNFLEHHHHLIQPIRNILEDLFEKPIRGANDTGSGLVVVPESCYGNKECMNILRPVYVKQFFGLNDETKLPIDGTCYRFSYGTGKGKSTSGVGDE